MMTEQMVKSCPECGATVRQECNSWYACLACRWGGSVPVLTPAADRAKLVAHVAELEAQNSYLEQLTDELAAALSYEFGKRVRLEAWVREAVTYVRFGVTSRLTTGEHYCMNCHQRADIPGRIKHTNKCVAMRGEKLLLEGADG